MEIEIDLSEIKVAKKETAVLLRKHGGKTKWELEGAIPIAEAAHSKPLTAKETDISIHDAAKSGNLEVVKQHLAAGTDVKDKHEKTPLYFAASGRKGHTKIVEILIAEGADVNAKDAGTTPLDVAEEFNLSELASILRKHGGKGGEELKAEGK